MASAPRTFLWINKDEQSSSLSSSNGSESSQILSHVQRVCASRRRLQRGRRLATVHDKKHKIESDDPDTREICISSPPENNHEPFQIQGLIIPAGLDQFSGTTMAVDKNSRELLGYHVEWWRAVAPNLKSWHEVDLSQPADMVIAQKCFQNPLYLLSIITFSSVQMEALKLPCAQPTRSNKLHSKTISALREAVASVDKDPMQLLEILSYMCLTEVFRCNFPACRMHLGAVKHLIGRVGGISRVLNYASDMILFSDFYTALSTLAQPILGHCINFDDGPPIVEKAVLQRSYDALYQLWRSDWVRELPHSILSWAVGQLISCVQILQHSWKEKRFVVNGFWVRKKCVSIIICLLDAWEFDSMPSKSTETARIAILLWSAFLLASTLDTQGARNYIPLFDTGTINKYQEAGLLEVASALTKWNRALAYNFGSIPLGCDVLLRVLLKVPLGIEKSGGVFLGDIMERFASTEESERLEKAMGGLRGDAERHHRWRVWRTSILLC